jgi:hypothetical protein
MRMRVRRAHEHPIGLVRLRRILDEAPKPADQCVVFDARLEMVIVLLGVLVHVALPRSAQSYRAIVRPQWV